MTITPSLTRDALAAVDAARHATEQLVAAEVAQVLAIVAMADTYRLDSDLVMAGVDRLMAGGADGTPEISEFVALELAGVLGVSPASAGCRLAEALNLRHRHPHLWQAFVGGQVRLWQASHVASRCAQAGLDAAAAGWVDAQMAIAARLKPWGRALGELERLILQADPALARQRAEQEAARRHVGIGPIEDGHCDLWGRLDAADALDLDATLSAMADELDPSLPKQQRRALSLGELARRASGQQPLIHAELIVHLDRPDGAVASLDAHGPVLREQLGDILSRCRSVTVRPVLDPAAVAASDSYTIPELMRLAVCERNPVDVFPFGTLASRHCDLDHTVPFDFEASRGAGQTRPSNLGPLSRRVHRGKTHAGWRLRQPTPGVFEWTSPAGCRYRVTREGTVRVGRSGAPPD